MFGQFFAGLGGGSFEASYRCYPVSFLDKVDAEYGDKIFLPPSALDRLASLHIEYPMLFKVENRRESKSTHCGVLEFVADEGMVYMPYWMMQNLLVSEGDVVSLRNASLPKGSYVKLQPHTKDFLDISNPKAVLERTLRNYSCLTVGDCICLYYNNKKYYINITEARPQPAISVIETDCEVDFAPPLDYVEPERDYGRAAAAPADTMDSETAAPAAGADRAVDADEAPEDDGPKFQPFTGTGMRLDGKAASPSSAGQASSSTAGQSAAARAALARSGGASGSGSGAATSNGSASGSGAKRAVAGKVVFGGGNRLLAKKEGQQQGQAAPPPAQKEEEKPEEPKFKAFSGKANTLK